MPDKAIDLIDESCEMIRTEIDSMPTELNIIRKKIIQHEIVFYKPLSKANIGFIVDLSVKDLNTRLKDKQIECVLTDNAKHLF